MSTVLFETNENNMKFSIIEEKENIVINYFSVFDKETFETESFECSFDITLFKSAVEEYKNCGYMKIENGDYYFKAEKNLTNNIKIELSSKNKSFLIYSINHLFD